VLLDKVKQYLFTIYAIALFVANVPMWRIEIEGCPPRREDDGKVWADDFPLVSVTAFSIESL
jgi:hypothetical protein